MVDQEIIEEPKKGKGKLIGIVGGVIVLLAAAYFLFFSGGGGGDPEADMTTTTVPAEGPVIEMDEMTVTLAGDPVHYAKIRFAVVLPEGGDTTVIGDRVPILKDAVLGEVSGLTVDEMLGAGALDNLRDQLTAAALRVFTEGEVLRVVVTEVLVQ
ncbi:MAG: flagellar basal body-associated FliL family protein [Acidimicrobiia bacterium]